MVRVKLTNLETKKIIKTQLPTKWEELTMEMFCNLMDAYKAKEKPSNFDIVAALMNVPVQWIRDSSVKQLDSNIFYWIMFLSDEGMMEKMWHEKPPKKFIIDGKEFERIDSIGEVMTLGQKEDLIQSMTSDASMLQKATLVINTFYKVEADVLKNLSAIDIFPIVAFFLRQLKRMMMLGAIKSGNMQLMKNMWQG